MLSLVLIKRASDDVDNGWGSLKIFRNCGWSDTFVKFAGQIAER